MSFVTLLNTLVRVSFGGYGKKLGIFAQPRGAQKMHLHIYIYICENRKKKKKKVIGDWLEAEVEAIKLNPLHSRQGIVARLNRSSI